jgi:hypothetical protein
MCRWRAGRQGGAGMSWNGWGDLDHRMAELDAVQRDAENDDK